MKNIHLLALSLACFGVVSAAPPSPPPAPVRSERPALHTPAAYHFAHGEVIRLRPVTWPAPAVTTRAPLAYPDHGREVDTALGLPRRQLRVAYHGQDRQVLVSQRPVFRGYLSKWTGYQWSPDFQYVRCPGYRACTYLPESAVPQGTAR